MSVKTDETLESVQRRGNGQLLMGSVIGMVSALGLAWNEGGGDVAHQVMTSRSNTVLVPLGQTLTQLGGCLLGAVIGGTLVSIGVLQLARRNGLSLAFVLLIGLHGLLAMIGMLAVLWGTYGQRAAIEEMAMSHDAITPTLVTQLMTQPVAMSSLGWRLMAIAQAVILIGITLQCVTRPKYMTTSTSWPVVTIAALIQMGLTGVIVSALWVRCGWTFQDYATDGVVKVSELVRQIQVVLFCSGVGSCILMGYALLITGLAGQAVITTKSPVTPDSETSSDPSSTLIG